MKEIALLGSTGSIGTQTLDIVRSSAGSLGVTALCAGRSWERLLEQVREFQPRVVGLADPEAAARLRDELPPGTALVEGPQAAVEIATEAAYDIAVHGIVGAAGVLPSFGVLSSGRTLALANKESLVVAGEPLMELARANSALILPVDSEHCALFQCLGDEDVGRVRRVLLTASGGAFRDLPPEQLERATPEMALRHPNWDMGPRITVGSATLMNKAFEVIETHHLFGLEPERIEVVLHRQSVCHSMVEFYDGSVLAQLSPPDMRGPIHFALHWPHRAPAALKGFDLEHFKNLTFEEVNRERFPALELGYDAVRLGGTAGASLNAADEVGVEAFLEGRIGFQEMAQLSRSVLEKCSAPLAPNSGAEAIAELLSADVAARSLARKEVARRQQSGVRFRQARP
ncbi:MAG: 1-deoxy-D-xylulose-5-phosphate reductoisomerase [Planctomycetes bacterium]|nr:1-deoxy-D-xylulose-5-phosphate reductoisomerase [Planctomycetota bacterium]